MISIVVLNKGSIESQLSCARALDWGMGSGATGLTVEFRSGVQGLWFRGSGLCLGFRGVGGCVMIGWV